MDYEVSGVTLRLAAPVSCPGLSAGPKIFLLQLGRTLSGTDENVEVREAKVVACHGVVR
jgi:hypothetical protein